MHAAHFVAAVSIAGIHAVLYGGAGGPRFSLSDMQALQDQADQELRLCKPWMPILKYRFYQHGFVQWREAAVCVFAAACPGLATLPVQQHPRGVVHTPPRVPCSGCGRPAVQLRKCSGCRQAAYCRRECQVRHWKEGGHRRECAQLAAAASSSAAT
jgi:hypothetical protein